MDESMMYWQEMFSSIITYVSTALQMIGLCALFIKIGKKGWKAFIPIYNEYELSRLAKRDYVGRVLILFHILCSFYSISLAIHAQASASARALWWFSRQ